MLRIQNFGSCSFRQMLHGACSHLLARSVQHDNYYLALPAYPKNKIHHNKNPG